MNEEQSSFLNNRLNALVEKQPDILILRDRLIAISGTHLVAPTVPEPDLKDLLCEGAVMKEAIHFEEMARSNCHKNVALLWQQRSGDLIALATGYALSDDGLWRQHSWGMRSNAIFETTEPRKIYFGVRLVGLAADLFSSRFF